MNGLAGKKKTKSVFKCGKCGYESLKWLGKCPDCGQWDSFTEETVSFSRTVSGLGNCIGKSQAPCPINDIRITEEARTESGIGEFDRVLGGGLVPGSLVLIGGDPGIGKSTLMLQALHGIARANLKTLYVSGEESLHQMRMRGKRLETLSPNLFVASEVEVGAILDMVEKEKPDVLVIDSIQTLYNSELTSTPGSVAQVRESAMRLMLFAKGNGIPVFLIGHVTKDGAIAGPRLLEHMVDTVLYFEGDKSHVFRILRAVKNRFGSTNEIGVFEMKEKGLMEVGNPSAVFLSERPKNVPGSVVTASIEGTRPILIEIQALTSPTSFGTPRRTVLGLDPNRVALLTAVMAKKLGMDMMDNDIFMNVAGGVKVVEPAVDMGIVAALASTFLDRPIPGHMVILGEVGLTGEVRAIDHVENRVGEMKKLGFTQCVMPKGCVDRMGSVKDIVLTGVTNVEEALDRIF